MNSSTPADALRGLAAGWDQLIGVLTCEGDLDPTTAQAVLIGAAGALADAHITTDELPRLLTRLRSALEALRLIDTGAITCVDRAAEEHALEARVTDTLRRLTERRHLKAVAS